MVLLLKLTEINTIYFLTPIAVIALSFGTVIYWHFKKNFTLNILLYSFIAYFSAIIIKYLFQYFTLIPYSKIIDNNQLLLGIYYGLQTALIEVGLAYLVAKYATTRGKLFRKDAAGYGLGLAMWENGVLISIPLLVNYLLYYIILASPSSGSFFSTLHEVAPALFLPTYQALPLIGFSILERASSLLVHAAWGYLTVIAAVTGKRRYLYAALPMGLIDFLVPYESSLGIATFEMLVFIVSSICLVIALSLGFRSQSSNPFSSSNSNDSILLFKLNFKRTVSFSRIYIVIGMILPIFYSGVLFFIPDASLKSSIGSLYPLLMPLFIIIGSIGPLWIFTSDKRKGVYEYLIASGIEVSSVFWSVLMITAGIVTMLLAFVLISILIIFTLAGVQITVIMVETIIFFTIPISYSSSILTSTAGMIWASLSKSMTGVNSPVGLAPLLGIIPILIAFLIPAIIGPKLSLYAGGIVSLAVLVTAIVVLMIANMKMDRERFLSNE